MQISEYFMWANPNCNKINTIATKFAIFTLILQIVTFFYIAYFFNILKINKYLFISIAIPLSFYYFYIIYKLIIYKKPLCSKPKPLQTHMVWDIYPFLNSLPQIINSLFFKIYFLLPIFSIIFYKNIFYFAFYFILYALLFIYSKYVNLETDKNKPQQSKFESLWCFLVNFVPISAIFYGYFYYKIRKSNKII